MEELWAGAGQLPEQVSPDQRLGRSVHQGQGAHQQRDGHETLPILQGKPNGGPLTVEKFIFHLYFTCSSKLSKFWMKKIEYLILKNDVIFYVEYLIMTTWFEAVGVQVHVSVMCSAAIWRGCFGLGRQTESHQRLVWCLDWRTEEMGLPGGHIHRERRHQGSASCRDFSLPGVNYCRLKWFIYDLILQIPIAEPLFLISFKLMKSCLNLEWALSSWLWWRRWHALLWWWTWSTSLTSRSSWSACLTSWGKSRKLLESIWREKEPRSQGTGTLCFIK